MSQNVCVPLPGRCIREPFICICTVYSFFLEGLRACACNCWGVCLGYYICGERIWECVLCVWLAGAPGQRMCGWQMAIFPHTLRFYASIPCASIKTDPESEWGKIILLPLLLDQSSTHTIWRVTFASPLSHSCPYILSLGNLEQRFSLNLKNCWSNASNKCIPELTLSNTLCAYSKLK